MLRFIATRLGLGALLAATLLGVSPATSQTATADELNVIALPSAAATTGVQSATQDRSGGLISFVRGSTLPAGPGHRSGPVKLGIWNARGYGHGFKIEFATHHGVPSNGNVPGMGTEDSRCTKTIDYRYKNAAKVTATAAQLVVLHRQNETPFRKWYRWAVHHHKVSKSVQARAKRINNACKHHSPFHASMETEPVYIGQVGSGTTSVVADHGLSAPAGLRVRTVGTGTRVINAASRINGHSRAGFSYRLIDFSGGSVQSTVSGPDATRADLLVTPDGSTRLLVNSYKAKASASSRVRQKVLTKPTMTTNNPYASTGTGTVKVKAKVPAHAGMPVRFTARNAGKNHRWYVKPGGKHGTKFHAADASKVTLSYCYVKHVHQGCASATHTYPGTPEVVAPAWINVDDQSHCCSSSGTTVKLPLTVNPSSKRFYRAWVIVNGKTVQALNLTSAVGSTPKTFTLRRGHIQVKVQAYRNSDYTGALSTPQYPYDRTFN